VIYEERKVLGYKLMNFDIACWKSILKYIGMGEIIPDVFLYKTWQMFAYIRLVMANHEEWRRKKGKNSILFENS
jgi:hypothetical protein